jgi:hypothetical protein
MPLAPSIGTPQSTALLIMSLGAIDRRRQWTPVHAPPRDGDAVGVIESTRRR